jgi:hypothetical protein
MWLYLNNKIVIFITARTLDMVKMLCFYVVILLCRQTSSVYTDIFCVDRHLLCRKTSVYTDIFCVYRHLIYLPFLSDLVSPPCIVTSV